MIRFDYELNSKFFVQEKMILRLIVPVLSGITNQYQVRSQ